MDDYRDIVAAGFAVLCAALMLVAWLLFTSDKPELGNSDPSIERPVETSLSISSLETKLRPWFSVEGSFLIQKPT
jgi:hypothetical protein